VAARGWSQTRRFLPQFVNQWKRPGPLHCYHCLLSSSQYPTTIKVGAEVEEINSMITSKLRLLPSMTHLIFLEQSPGRMRFIFCGEWIDEYVENLDGHGSTLKSVLQCPPGDDDSIESRWITWDEGQCLHEQNQIGCSNFPTIQFISDPWLRARLSVTE
jgi:hypothetical protein